jgi:hypothetical protein
MRRVLTDPSLRVALMQRGLAQAKRFTWDDAAAAVLEELEKAQG